MGRQCGLIAAGADGTPAHRDPSTGTDRRFRPRRSPAAPAVRPAGKRRVGLRGGVAMRCSGGGGDAERACGETAAGRGEFPAAVPGEGAKRESFLRLRRKPAQDVASAGGRRKNFKKRENRCWHSEGPPTIYASPTRAARRWRRRSSLL